MIKYKVTKKDGETLIRETGHFREYTLTELNDIIAANEKSKKEAEANLKLRGAELINIIEHYPKVLEFTPEEIFRIAMYGKTKLDVEAYEKKIAEFDEALTRQYNTKKIIDESN